jgi:hypothetical protein
MLRTHSLLTLCNQLFRFSVSLFWGSCYSVRSAACLAVCSSSCLRWSQSMHSQDQQINSVTGSQCSDVWVVHQLVNVHRRWTDLHCVWATVYWGQLSNSLDIFFWQWHSASSHQQCVCASFSFHRALLKCIAWVSSDVCSSWSWAAVGLIQKGVSMKFIHSVICTEKDSNDVSVRNHFLMSELKVLNIWTVIAVMLTSVCTSFAVTLSQAMS